MKLYQGLYDNVTKTNSKCTYIPFWKIICLHDFYKISSLEISPLSPYAKMLRYIIKNIPIPSMGYFCATLQPSIWLKRKTNMEHIYEK